MVETDLQGNGASPGRLSAWRSFRGGKRLTENRSTIKLLDLDLEAPESPRSGADGPTDNNGFEIGAGWPRDAPLIDLDDTAPPTTRWEEFGSAADGEQSSPTASLRALHLHQRAPSSESIIVKATPLSRATSGNPFSSDAASLPATTPRPAPLRTLGHQHSLPAQWHGAPDSMPETPASAGGRLHSVGSLPTRFSGPLPDAWFAPGLAEVPPPRASLTQRQAIFDASWSPAAANVDPCAEVLFNTFAEFSRDLIPAPKSRAAMKPRWLQPWAEGSLPEGEEAPEPARQ